MVKKQQSEQFFLPSSSTFAFPFVSKKKNLGLPVKGSGVLFLSITRRLLSHDHFSFCSVLPGNLA
jgi:hypothetical protein